MRLAPNVVVVEEYETVYLIPPLHPPLRLNRPGVALYRRLLAANSIEVLVEQHAMAEQIDMAEAAEEIRAFLNTLTQANCHFAESC
jgi:hypothetical protein